MLRLAHLSDLHATPVRVDRPLDFASKRLLGWLSWHVRRSRVHRAETLAALVDDARQQAAEQVVVTGDLTNVASPREFPEARLWLERLGRPEHVFVIPGNHDAYVGVPRSRGWDLWQEFLAPDEGEPVDFPTLRVRGALALVGVCTAHPTPPFSARGTVGRDQLERLEKLLVRLGERGLCRVVLIHHPVSEGAVSPRRALSDARELRAVLAAAGAELVLHGHGHRTLFTEIPGPDGSIPVVCAPSSSDVRRASYHLYEIEPAAGEGPRAPRADDRQVRRFRITARIRRYDPATGSFATEGERVL